MSGPINYMSNEEIQRFQRLFHDEERVYDNIRSSDDRKSYLKSLENFFNESISIFADEENSPVISSVFSSKEKQALRNKNLNYADRYQIIYKKRHEMSDKLNDIIENPEEDADAVNVTRILLERILTLGVDISLYYKKSLDHCPCAASMVKGREHTLMAGGGRKKRTKKKSRRRKRKTLKKKRKRRKKKRKTRR